MAYLLVEKCGVGKVIILEKGSKRRGVFGKSVSVDDTDNPEIYHEMGACYLHSAYYAIVDLVKELGLEKTHLPMRDLKGTAGASEDVAEGFGRPYRFQLTEEDYALHPNLRKFQRNADEPGFATIGDYNLALTEETLLWPSLWGLPDKLQLIPVVGSVIKYMALHRAILGEYEFSMPPFPRDEAIQSRLNKSFKDFLVDEGVSALVPLFRYAMQAQGYRSLEKVAAWYGLGWITPIFMRRFLERKIRGGGSKLMLKGRFSDIWQACLDKGAGKIEILYDVEVQEIKRGPDIEVLFAQQGRETDRRVFDYLVMACPPTPEMFGVLGRPEYLRFYYERLSFLRFATAVLNVDPMPEHEEHVIIFPRALAEGKGDVQALRDTVLSSQRIVRDNDTRPRHPVSYQMDFEGKLDANEFEKRLESSLKAAGIPFTGFQQPLRVFDYFYSYDVQGIRERLPREMLKCQGMDNTLFVHASTYFESTFDVVNYNLMLVSAFTGA